MLTLGFFRPATISQYLPFDFGFRFDLPAFDRAIATACRCGLPSLRSFAIFCETVFEELPGFNGMSSLQLVERFASAGDDIGAVRENRVDDVPDSDIACLLYTSDAADE